MALTHVGDAIALRPKVPIQDPQRLWLQGEMSTFVQDLLHSRPLFLERFLDVEAVRRLYGQFLKQPDRFENLTCLVFPVFLEVWHRAMRDVLEARQTCVR